MDNPNPNKLQVKGKRQKLTPERIKALATVTPQSLLISMQDIIERNPVLASVLLAQPIKPNGKRKR